jgi:TATA-binding protein-associated factor Taf7
MMAASSTSTRPASAKPIHPCRCEHDHEEVQHDDAAGVHEHLNHGEKLRRQQHVERGDREEIQDEIQHAVHGVARAHDEHGEPEDKEREYVKSNRVQHLFVR